MPTASVAGLFMNLSAPSKYNSHSTPDTFHPSLKQLFSSSLYIYLHQNSNDGNNEGDPHTCAEQSYGHYCHLSDLFNIIFIDCRKRI